MSLISEQIEKIKKVVKEYRNTAIGKEVATTADALESCIDIIEYLSTELQAANMEWSTGDYGGKWTYCGDGKNLPENNQEVLVWYEYFRYGEYNCMYQTYGIGFQINGHWGGDVSGYKARCIAWRPLPEPYHEP